MEFSGRYLSFHSSIFRIPAPGYYNDDDTIDFMIRSNSGPGFPLFYHSNVSLLILPYLYLLFAYLPSAKNTRWQYVNL